jgi:alanine racemase
LLLKIAKKRICISPIHIKLDTGMHRLGFEDDSMDWIATLKGNENGEGAKYSVASGHK